MTSEYKSLLTSQSIHKRKELKVSPLDVPQQDQRFCAYERQQRDTLTFSRVSRLGINAIQALTDYSDNPRD